MQFELTSPYRSAYEGNYPRWLFVCSSGQLRSPTAAFIANRDLGINARSCGTEPFSLIPISYNLVHWADNIVFMDEACYNQAVVMFDQAGLKDLIKNSNHEVWNITDCYPYMDHELVDLIKQELKSKLPPPYFF